MVVYYPIEVPCKIRQATGLLTKSELANMAILAGLMVNMAILTSLIVSNLAHIGSHGTFLKISICFLTLICIEALQNQWCFRVFFLIFCHHLHLEPRVVHCQLSATLILVSGHCLFPLSVEGIHLAYQLVP